MKLCLSKYELGLAYRVTWKTLKKRLEKHGVTVPSDIRMLPPAMVEEIYNVLGKPQ